MGAKDILDSKFEVLKLNSKLAEIKKKAAKNNNTFKTMILEGGVKARVIIQSLLFPVGKYDLSSAKKWAKEKGYSADKADVTKDFIHLTQKSANMSKFTGHAIIKGISKFQEVTAGSDIKMPLEVEMWFFCEGENRDGIVRKADLEESLDYWKGLPIIDWHDMVDMKNPTSHQIKDRKGYLGVNPRVIERDGRTWVVNEAYITNSDLAYLIYVSNKVGKPLEVSPEYEWMPLFVNGTKYQTNINPFLITVVDKGHLKGNQMRIKESTATSPLSA